MTKPRIVAFGEVLWDLFPDRECFGGAPANFACHASIQGGQVSILSAVGRDLRGDEALRILNGFGIETDLVQRDLDAPTGSVGVSVDAAGKPTFTIHEGSAWDRIEWNRDLETRASSADAVYFGTLGQRSEVSRRTIRRCLETAKNSGVLIVVDINLRAPFYDTAMIRESIQLASILKLSDDELIEVCLACDIPANESANSLLRSLIDSQGLDLVIMTLGAKGAALVTSDGIVEQPGIPTIVRDTVGAGDAFTAAFILGLLRGKSHEQNLFDACSIAAAACSHSGAVPTQEKE